MNFEIGTITTPNPWLWVFSNFTDYQVSTLVPGENWFQVNQFCSILAVDWLQNPAATFGFRDLSGEAQLEAARTLQQFQSLQDQVDYAVQQLNGRETDVQSVIDNLADYEPGTQLWLGNNSHAVAGLIVMQGRIKVVRYYNPDTGDTEDYTTAVFGSLITALEITAAVTKTP